MRAQDKNPKEEALEDQIRAYYIVSLFAIDVIYCTLFCICPIRISFIDIDK